MSREAATTEEGAVQTHKSGPLLAARAFGRDGGRGEALTLGRAVAAATFDAKRARLLKKRVLHTEPCE